MTVTEAIGADGLGSEEVQRSRRRPVLPHTTSPDSARYVVERELARGGMGSVFLVRDQHLGRTVAMKRILASEPSRAQLRRFLQEAQIAGQLDHPNVMTVHEVGFDEHGHYFTMPYVKGSETLEHVIEKLRTADPDYRRRYALGRRVQIVQQVARAVDFAHDRGVLHRDIKPANILVGPLGEVLLLDWGLARVRSAAGRYQADAVEPVELVTDPASSDPNTVHGTLLYMAPEQLRGKSDARSDVYSLSAVLWEVLSLRHYMGANPGSIRHLIARLSSCRRVDLNEQPLSGNTRLPEALVQIATKGLVPNPSRRYQTARELADDLQLWLEHSPVYGPDTQLTQTIDDDLQAELPGVAKRAIQITLSEVECTLAIRASGRRWSGATWTA